MRLTFEQKRALVYAGAASASFLAGFQFYDVWNKKAPMVSISEVPSNAPEMRPEAPFPRAKDSDVSDGGSQSAKPASPFDLFYPSSFQGLVGFDESVKVGGVMFELRKPGTLSGQVVVRVMNPDDLSPLSSPVKLEIGKGSNVRLGRTEFSASIRLNSANDRLANVGIIVQGG